MPSARPCSKPLWLIGSTSHEPFEESSTAPSYTARENGLNSLSEFTDLVTGRPSLRLPREGPQGLRVWEGSPSRPAKGEREGHRQPLELQAGRAARAARESEVDDQGVGWGWAESKRTPHVPRGMRSGARGGGESIPRALSWLVQGDSGLASWLLTQGSFHSSGRLSTRGWRRSVRKADSGLWGLVGKTRCTGEALGRKGRCRGGATRKMNHSPPCLPLSFPESTREQALTLALCVIWCG